MTPGEAGKEYGDVAQDWTLMRSELVPAKRRVTIKELMMMGEMDETVAAMMYAIETTLAQVEWRHEACVDGEESKDPKAIEAAEFADTILSDMETSFDEYVENALSFLLGGFDVSEVLFRQRLKDEGSRFTDGLWTVKSIVQREQTSITGWVVKDGAITGVKQSSTTGEKIIPIAKVLHLTVRGGPNKPEGRSLFRSAYRPYLLKRRIQDSEAIGVERDLCGLPVMKMPMADIEAATLRPETDEGKMAAARVKAAQAAVSDMRLNEAGGLVIPSDTYEDENGKPGAVPLYDFRIVTSGGSRTIDTRGAIREYDLSITRIAMMQFLRLGDRAGGSYALSDTQSSLALRSIRAIVKKIKFEWRKKVLTALWLLNGMDMRYLPKLGSSAITEDSLEEIGKFLEALASAKELLDEDAELSEDMKSRLGARRSRTAPPKPKVVTEPKPNE